MPDGIEADISELLMLRADIGEVSVNAGRFVNSAVQRTSSKITDSWKEKLYGSQMLPHLSRAIGWTITTGQGEDSTTIRSDIGPADDKKQAAFAHLNEYGSVHNPPRGYGAAALQENEQDFKEGLEKAVADAVQVLEANRTRSLPSSAAGVIRGRY